MTESIASKTLEKVLDFVSKNEDYHYSRLTCGEKPMDDLMNTSAAFAFQKVRYFITDLLEQQDKTTV